MVTTRRKRRSEEENGGETLALVDHDEAEAALEAAETTRRSKAKKARVERSNVLFGRGRLP